MYITTTPNNIIHIVEQSICPVCKEKLDANVETCRVEDLICSSTTCLDMEDHYNAMWEYKDPKHILLITQTISIREDNKHYQITLWQDEYDHTDIQVEDMDSEVIMNRYYHKERIFDFKKFNRDRWIKELKTLMLFG